MRSRQNKKKKKYHSNINKQDVSQDTALDALKKVQKLGSSAGKKELNIQTDLGSSPKERHLSAEREDYSPLSQEKIDTTYYDELHDARFSCYVSELELKTQKNLFNTKEDLLNKISDLKTYIEQKLSETKDSLLRWAIGLIIAIILSLIGYHFYSISSIKDEIIKLNTNEKSSIKNKNTLQDSLKNENSNIKQ